MGSDDLDKLARGLTAAQAEAMRAPSDRMSQHYLADFTLADMGLKKPVYCHLEQAWGHRFTRRGLALKTHIERNEG